MIFFIPIYIYTVDSWNEPLLLMFSFKVCLSEMLLGEKNLVFVHKIFYPCRFKFTPCSHSA
jgi:hypothetical protein